MAPESNCLEFDAVTTLDDHAALYTRVMRQPGRILNLLIVAAAAFVWYTLALSIQDLFDGVDSLAELTDPAVYRDYAAGPGWHDLTVAAMTVGAWVGGFVVFVVAVLQPLRARSFARRILRDRPDIDAKDRKLTQRHHCRLDAEGCTWSVPDTRSTFAWSHFTRIVETRRHLFMMISPAAGMVFSKRAMDRGLVDDIRAFARRHIGEPGHDLAGREDRPATSEHEVISFEVLTTLEDQLALRRHLNASIRGTGGLPPWARGVIPNRMPKQFRFWPMFVVFFGLSFLGVVTNHDQGGGFLKSHFGTSAGWKLAVQLSIGLAMVFIIPGVLGRWWGRWQTRVAHREIHAGRPDVAPGDPTMAVRRHVRFDDDGFTTRTDAVAHWESWRRINGLEETPDLLVLRVGKAVGYAFPKCDLSSAVRERLPLYVIQRCASKWPF